MRQWLRQCQLVIGKDGKGLDLSQLRITFDVEKNDQTQPNPARICVYNPAPDTINRALREFDTVSLQAGYVEGMGLIYAGNLIQVRRLRKGSDIVLELSAGDGDTAYNYGVVRTTLSAGATDRDRLGALARAMADGGIESGAALLDAGTGRTLPRGKVLYKPVKEYMREYARDTRSQVYIDSGKLVTVKRSGYLSGPPVELAPGTGLIGAAQQTLDGVEASSRLNPEIRIGGLIHIDPAYLVAADTVNQQADKTGKKKTVHQSAGGYYRVISVHYTGDTHGMPWDVKIIGVAVDASAKKTLDTPGGGTGGNQ